MWLRTGDFMRLWIGAGLTALVVGGCAPSLSGANETGGILDHVAGMNRDQAFSQAQAHCARYGKIAHITNTDVWGSTMTFDCVKP